MTDLLKPVARRTRCLAAGHGPEARRIVVSLEPGDVLGFRLERTRRVFTLAIADAYRMAVRVHVEAEKAAKRARRRARR